MPGLLNREWPRPRRFEESYVAHLGSYGGPLLTYWSWSRLRQCSPDGRRSLWLHRAIADKLLGEPATTLDRARRDAKRMMLHRPVAAPAPDERGRGLGLSVDRIVDVMEDPRLRARDLRQVTQVAGRAVCHSDPRIPLAATSSGSSKPSVNVA